MKMLKLSLMGMAAMALLTACRKDNEEPMPGLSRIQVVHASPDAPAVDILANNQPFIQGLAFPSSSGYREVASGDYNIKVAPAGTTNYVIDANATLLPGQTVSVWAVNTVSNISAAITVDDLTPPAAGRAHVRFMHLSPDAPAVDIALADGGSVLFANRSFNDQATSPALQAFTAIDAGTYNLEVRVAGTNTVALPLPNITLEPGRIYTVFAKGLLNAGEGDAELDAGIIVNNP